MSAAQMGNINLVSLLLENKADVNAKNSRNETALLLAAGGPNWLDEEAQKYNRHPEVIKLLLNYGADINEKSRIDAGIFQTNPLFATIPHLDRFKTLLTYGPDFNIKDQYGETALYRAINSGDPEIVKLSKDWYEPSNDYNKEKSKIDTAFKKHKDKVREATEKHLIKDEAGITMDYFGEPYESAFEYFIHETPKYKDKIEEFEQLKAAAMPAQQTSSEPSSSSSSSSSSK